MKKSWIVVLLLGLLITSPLILAQEPIQEPSQNSIESYSNFNRFIDNTRLFFSFKNNKVSLALEIREKEINSALENIQKNNEEKANENLQNALDKLLIIQEKVSFNNVDKVTESVNRVLNKIEEHNLTKFLDRYILEEKKTQLVTELIVEVEGKEGQILTREIIKNETSGQKQVFIKVDGKEGQNLTRVVEIQKGINQIDSNISDWVVEHTYAEGTSAGGEAGVIFEGGQRVVVQGTSEGDNGFTNEVRNYIAGDGTLRNDSLPEPDLNQFNPDLYDPNARAEGDTIDETYDDASLTSIDNGITTEGSQGTQGTNEIGPAVDSNEGD